MRLLSGDLPVHFTGPARHAYWAWAAFFRRSLLVFYIEALRRHLGKRSRLSEQIRHLIISAFKPAMKRAAAAFPFIYTVNHLPLNG
jgi:hypothetical protein